LPLRHIATVVGGVPFSVQHRTCPAILNRSINFCAHKRISLPMAKNQFNDEDIWKGIILFGLNVATYKMALARSLFEFAKLGNNEIKWGELSVSFPNQYINRLDCGQMPQQGNPTRLSVMERVVHGLKTESISQTKALDRVATKGLENVVPRFQTIGQDSNIVKNHFYDFEFGKSLHLKDTLLGFTNAQLDELDLELVARWSLLEGAFTINQTDYQLGNNIRDTYLYNGYERTTLTCNVPFLSGYQGNVCFYCGELLRDDVHVDHVLPRQVVNHDEIWNLVLAHGNCNLLKSDKLVGPHFIKKLVARNENIMGSNHPWKYKISTELGSTPAKRAATLSKHYKNVKTVLGSYWWGGASSYNPSTDPFYRRFITVLNNGNLI